MGNSLTANPKVRSVLAKGIVIPAHPLALSAGRGLDERRQRALTRYYVAAGAGGVAVGVHTTQFAIRDPRIGLFEPVLRLAAEELDRADQNRAEPLVRIGGICGEKFRAILDGRCPEDRPLLTMQQVVLSGGEQNEDLPALRLADGRRG